MAFYETAIFTASGSGLAERRCRLIVTSEEEWGDLPGAVIDRALINAFEGRTGGQV